MEAPAAITHQDALASALTRQGMVLILWSTPHCLPCVAYAPVVTKVAERNPDVFLATVDVHAQPALARELGVEAIPTLMLLRDGVPVLEHAGPLPEDVLAGVVEEARSVDLEALRQALAQAA